MRRCTPSYWDSQLTLGLWSGPESPPGFHPIALSSQHISEIPGVFTDPDHRRGNKNQRFVIGDIPFSVNSPIDRRVSRVTRSDEFGH
jgi:hypothetical protein